MTPPSSHFSRHLPHVLPRKDLAVLLAPTYARVRDVDEEEATERLGRALESPAALDAIYRGVSAALAAAKGPRTAEDVLMDRISARLAARRSRVKSAEVTPAVSAALVRLDLELGLAPESMRETLASPRGSALLEAGLRELGAHLLKDLLRP